MERTAQFIKVWFWRRNNRAVQPTVKNGSSTLDTSKFGVPFAIFVSDKCPIDQYFGEHHIIINLTLCTCFTLALNQFASG